MQKHLSKIVMLQVMILSGFSFQNLSAEHHDHQNMEGLCQQETHDSELTFLASPNDLYLHEGNIVLKVEGIPYSVQNLKRVGDQWLATIDNANTNYCPRFHMTCKDCHQCHTTGCWYYVRNCKLWDPK